MTLTLTRILHTSFMCDIFQLKLSSVPYSYLSRLLLRLPLHYPIYQQRTVEVGKIQNLKFLLHMSSYKCLYLSPANDNRNQAHPSVTHVFLNLFNRNTLTFVQHDH